MELSVIQIVLVTFVAYCKCVDWTTAQVTAFNTLFWSWITGLVIGAPEVGLAVGATMQLMSMGVIAVGGASMPDYPVAAIIATVLAVTTGEGIEAGLAVGIPVAMLCVNFDVLIKIMNSYLRKKEEDLIQQGRFKAALNVVRISPFAMGLCSAIPVFVCITLGPSVVNAVLEVTPVWFTKGLSIAGGLLPAVGLAMLLMYMPLNKYWSFLAVGFVLSAYLHVPVLGIAAVGLAAAYEVYKTQMKEATATVSSVGGLEDE